MSSSTRSRLRLPETGPWYQSAADHRRQRLFHAGIVPLFAAALALVLLLAFPSQDLSNKLARAERSDLLTISYLRAWLSAKPDDWPLRLTLARHLTLIGRYDEALGALEAIRGGERELRRAAEHQRLVVLERKAWSLPEDSPLRAELLVVTGKSAVRSVIENLGIEELDVPAGKVSAYHLGSSGHRGELKIDIWLARDYANLPVRLKITDKNGEVLDQVATGVDLGARPAAP